ncbi:MAG: thioredoxin domain-containing protein [Candidatus Omnitrophica bacterium]|nr:thioredoxin domain-containing protein [Candidatus Omnitrophota bacterium]
MNFERNNLDLSTSPYLRQHKENPIWWQEWGEATLEYAKKKGKPLFFSVGYSTCHWCHVMAAEAFSNKDIADFLNKNFISVKVDREERPDIDQFLMRFILSLNVQGGWPLNAFLTPNLNPLYALTYAPVEPQARMPGFLEILEKIYDFYRSAGHKLSPFILSESQPPVSAEEEIIKMCYEAFDQVYGGFGQENKFPPSSTLLYLLYYSSNDQRIRLILEKTLDVMMLRGLHDHLEGGFFRYCVDREWLIPHFEKMLYDQAMMLWIYALAFKVLGKKEYKETAFKIVKSLEDTFERDGLFCSAFDADINHEEGGYYLWAYDELSRILTEEELSLLKRVYFVTEKGNFEGKNHLIRLDGTAIPLIEQKLLFQRRLKEPPFCDEKIVTSWNALLGVAFIHAYRYLSEDHFLAHARKIASCLLERHFDGVSLARTSLSGKKSSGGFLEDGAAVLLLLTYLHEETGEFKEAMDTFYAYVLNFRTERSWKESSQKDFITLPASHFDHPIPSSVSLAELAVLRATIFQKKQFFPGPYVTALFHDFYNISSLVRNGLFHLITSPQKIGWKVLPVNTIQIRGEKQEDCFAGSCTDINLDMN